MIKSINIKFNEQIYRWSEQNCTMKLYHCHVHFAVTDFSLNEIFSNFSTTINKIHLHTHRIKFASFIKHKNMILKALKINCIKDF